MISKQNSTIFSRSLATSEVPVCPVCGEPLDDSQSLSSFCSSRCKLIDLGQWLDETYCISRDDTPEDNQSDDDGGGPFS